jgi:hypothetical protein
MPILINNFDDFIQENFVATAPKSAVHEPPLPPKTVYFSTGTGTGTRFFFWGFPLFPPVSFSARFFESCVGRNPGGDRTSIRIYTLEGEKK